jgi:hypothetical protein
MSWVTSVLAFCDIQDRDAVDALNDWLARDAPRRSGSPVGHWASWATS